MKRSDRDWLLDALDYVDILNQHLGLGGIGEQVIFDAALLRLSSAIESLSHVSDALRRSVISDTLWREIKGTRNLIAHEYGFVDQDQLRAIFEGDSARLEADIRRMLERAPV